MIIFRRIIGGIVLISGAFYAISGLTNTFSISARVVAIGVIFTGGVTWFLMQLNGSQTQREELKEPTRDYPQKPLAKEDELIHYIRSNILISNTCSTSRYNNKNINFDGLVQDISDFYVKNLNCSKPSRIQFDNVVSLVSDKGIVVLIRGVNNLVVKVHVPADTSEEKDELVRSAPLALEKMISDKSIDGGSLGRINPGLALRKSLRDNGDKASEALKQQRRRLEGSIAKYIDNHIKDRQSAETREPVDMIYLRNLRNWRT
jgi:hypothetical protein